MSRLPALAIVTALLATVPGHPASENRWWNVGPMFHWEFGEHGHGFTFGIETSYWWEDAGRGFPAGFDVGFELTKTKVRLYTEAQAGLLGGASLGPFLEMPIASQARAWGDRGPILGMQGSIWGWWLAGADLRLRVSREDLVVSPGLYGKLGSCLGPCDFF